MRRGRSRGLALTEGAGRTSRRAYPAHRRDSTIVFTVDVDATSATVRVRGELDPDTGLQLIAAAGHVPEPVVDLADTTFIDAGGLAALVHIQPSRLQNVSDRLRRVFAAGGLTGMLPPSD